MAALLGVFKSSVPALVRRRAKELLEVIREGVRRGLEGKQVAKVEEDTNKTGSEVVAQDAVSKEKMDVDSIPPQAPSSQSFWGKGKFFGIMRYGTPFNLLPLVGQPSTPSTSVPLAPKSSLFGSTISTSRGSDASSYTTSTSALFGNMLGKPGSGVGSPYSRRR